MKLKKLLALLLALAMVFSLAACAGKDADDDDDDDEKTEQTSKKDDEEDDEDDGKKDDKGGKLDYTALVDAFEDFTGSPSMKGFATLAGGDLAGDEMYSFLKAYMTLMGMTEEDFVEMAGGEYEGTKVTNSSAEPLTEEELADYQADLDGVAQGFRDMIEDVKGTTDEDWAEIAEQFGLSVEDAKAFGEDIVSALEDLIAATDGLQIEDAQHVTLSVEDAEGNADDVDFYFFTANGKWFSDGLFEMSF